MVLLEAFPSGWELEVLASDLSTKVLDRAAAGLWPLEKAKEIPDRYLKAYMLKGYGAQEGLMKAAPEIRNVVRFARVNLVGDGWPSEPFDLVFCRNVLIYFDRPTQQRILSRLVLQLKDDGLLFLGHSESVLGFDGLAPVGPTVYRRTTPASSSAAARR